MKKVSFVCTTYRRFECVERLIAQYHAQTYKNKELIIFNTDNEYPLELDFEDDSIIVINNDIDYISKQPYTNRGDILRDAITHASGYYFMLADDDDVYLPWHIQQAVEGIVEIGKDAWKPMFSLWVYSGELKFNRNVMEASVIAKMDRIRELNFEPKSGQESLYWYTILRNEGNLNEFNTNFIASYCFYWADSETAGHKQSGDLQNPENFENHKKASLDYARRPLTKWNRDRLDEFYKRFYDYISEHKSEVNLEYFDRYAKDFIN